MEIKKQLIKRDLTSKYKDSVLGEFIQQWMETLEKYRDGNITFE